jgi:hypothetical protein
MTQSQFLRLSVELPADTPPKMRSRMITRDLPKLTLEQLAEMYHDRAERMDYYHLIRDISKFNHVYDRLAVIENEIRSRGIEASRVLIPFTYSKIPYLRYNAAYDCYYFDPKTATQALESIADCLHPCNIYARQLLRAIAEGRFIASEPRVILPDFGKGGGKVPLYNPDDPANDK